MSGPDTEGIDLDLVPPGTPITLDNCAREPIHIPGSIQPRGVLIVVREPDHVVTQVSTNVTELLGIAVDDALGRTLGDVIGADAASRVARVAAAFGDLRERNPLEVMLPVDGQDLLFDAILHRAADGILLVELEVAYGPRPFSFPNTYLAVRGTVSELNRAATMRELYEITARAVRSLTGFDRVMVYRYDHEYNGEVVAEDKREDLNSFLGLHYPATDIPAQARALYERNWIRLISDVDYAPSPLVPTDDPTTGAPIDLTFSTLRSVSPIHIEYLKNMGVHASMSISLLRDGKLWGLIACHHYSGPHLPPYGTRAAAEFLGSTLSLRLIDQYDDEDLRQRLAAQGVLAKITAATLDQSETLTTALLGDPNLLDLVEADGVALSLSGRYATRGQVPPDHAVRTVANWAQDAGEELVASDHLAADLPDLGIPAEQVSGALVLTLPENQFAVWFRREALRNVDWGGDPHNKAIAVQEGDTVRLSPRRSFDRWRETVREHSAPWTSTERDVVVQLRRHLVESLYQRSRDEVRLARTLQQSLLTDLPAIAGWDLSAHYEPAAGGRIGGDWYDAVDLGDGAVVVVLGDVAGHGIPAAGTMAQLRNVLRAYLFDGASPDEALARLNAFTGRLLPTAFATAVVVRIELATGHVTAASAGHPAPFVLSPDADPHQARMVTSPPLGVHRATYHASEFDLAPDHGLVLFSDGLFERRDETVDDGIARLAAQLQLLGDADARTIWAGSSGGDTQDDTTVLALRRLP